MATHLDLQEQEQIDAIKSFWQQYGNLITWTVTLALAGFAAWNGWNYWQGKQAVQAASMFEELDRAAQAGDVDKTTRIFNDLKERFGKTALAEQGGMLAARVQYDKGRPDAALASLSWVAESAADDEYKAVAHLRLASLLLDKKRFDDALRQLDSVKGTEFAALGDDRRGDVLLAMGRKDEAKSAYLAAWKAMEATLDYRRIVESKLTALAAAPTPASGVTP